jgi:hypothetical protein
MSKVMDDHRRVALEILASRASATKAWTMAAGASQVALEQELWGQLTAEEQGIEQQWLSAFWDRPGAVRSVVMADGRSVVIPDTAFGLATSGYRPWVVGPYHGGVGLDRAWAWLWLRGYQVVDYSDVGDVAVMVIPSHRLVAESDRLVRMMVGRGGVSELDVGPYTGGVVSKPVSVTATYDAGLGVASMASLRLYGVGILAGGLGR